MRFRVKASSVADLGDQTARQGGEDLAPGSARLREEATAAIEGVISPASVRDALARLATSADAVASGFSLLFLLRAVAIERGEGAILELCPHARGTLVTLLDEQSDIWFSEVVPITFANVEAALAEMSIHFAAFERSTLGQTLALRPRTPVPSVGPHAMATTQVELPSLALLIEAGLPSAQSVPSDKDER